MKLYLGADHAGFAVKEKVKRLLDKKKVTYEDLGAYKLNPKDDYPDFALKVAKKVAKEKDSKGILICGTGIGMGIAANKVKGIRAAMAYDTYSAKMSRLHNDSNILELRSWNFPFNKNEKIVITWLKTPFEGRRHKRRLAKISRFEK